MSETQSRSRFWVLFLLTFLISSSVFFTDSFRDDNFRKVDSAYYATISQNIVRTGDWLNLSRYRGSPFEGDHPPLVFWMTALSLKLLGNSVFAAIFFSLCCAIGTSLLVFLIGTFLKNDLVGFLSAAGLLLTRYVPRMARLNTIEIPLMFFVTLAILALILTYKKHRAFYLLFGFSIGLAILAKGIVGFYPLVICFLALFAWKRFSDLWNPYFLGGILIAVAIPGTWLFLKGNMTLGGGFYGFRKIFQLHFWNVFRTEKCRTCFTYPVFLQAF